MQFFLEKFVFMFFVLISTFHFKCFVIKYICDLKNQVDLA